MAFRVGQKVVCVNVDGPGIYNSESRVVLGAVYTIRELALTRLGNPGLRLQEVVLSCRPRQVGVVTKEHFTDAPYGAFRFRPAVERKTFIETFTKRLIPKRVDA